MKFKDFPYTRPDIEKMKKDFTAFVDAFSKADTFEEQDAIMKKIYAIRADFSTLSNIANVRNTIDTTDAFYDAEREFFDENGPVFQGLVTDFYKALTRSKFRSQMEHTYGRYLFDIADTALQTFKPEILEDLQKENQLTSEYVKLMASIKVVFDGKEMTLSGIGPYRESKDRSIRKAAAETQFNAIAEHHEKLDSLYHELVQIRVSIAKKLGFNSFVELGYKRMGRTDYDAAMVANFRSQVRDHIVPIATELRKRQAKRIGVDVLKYYDEPFNFTSGNAKPHGEPDWIINNGKKMYKELSPETDEFFTFMTDNELMDLLNKKGKAGGGYCTFFENYQSPFIFSNFNGTSGDVDVLTHEAGHAFQVYMSRHFPVSEYYWGTSETSEIHSMSMEFFTWPWMDLFFEDEADKYRFSHMEGALLFIPYGVAVDEFQHFVYENPAVTPEARRKKWLELEKVYLPWRVYENNDYLEQGGFWQRQAHIYEVPFYYIDYTLAQICALQFWKRSREDRKTAWNDYVRLCAYGGSAPFQTLVQKSGLISPFADGCVKSVVGEISAWLNSIDDSKF